MLQRTKARERGGRTKEAEDGGVDGNVGQLVEAARELEVQVAHQLKPHPCLPLRIVLWHVHDWQFLFLFFFALFHICIFVFLFLNYICVRFVIVVVMVIPLTLLKLWL